MNDLTIHNKQIDILNSNNITPSMLLNDETFYLVEELTVKNERQELNRFSGFSDLAMMYYFIHREKHVRHGRNRGGNTKQEYTRILLQFYKYLEDNRSFFEQEVSDYDESSLLKNLRPRHVNAFQKYLSTASLGRGGKPYKAATLHQKNTVIKGFLIFLFDNGYIQDPLHQSMLSTSISKDEIPNRDLYYHEVKQLLDLYQNNPITLGLLTTLSMTGLRIQEVAKAKMKDLYYDAISGNYRLRGIGKGGTPFDVLIHPVNFERIMAFRKRRRMSTALDPLDESPLFATQKREQYGYKNLSNFIIREVNKTNLPFLVHRESKITPHSFRHFFAIYSRQMGADISEIQQALRHKDRRTTERYLEKVLEREREVALRWDQSKF
ncbi:site-specific integrase [Bacillus sp. WMMC1349]|uniref:tyrosine-type recombinase/integrase n=1 Tax=Bacillus sp. WMMC1349 TaxID=2736254 RepID=UPI001554FF08|nr:site-specific integrase [Bacillus sp. WMMC1349]NPC92871.1 site-specific integrase [Bacillus sp. WMMC1349]